MSSKNILSIVAFVAAFGLSVAFASLFIGANNYSYNSTNCFKYQQNAAAARTISALIAEDTANGRVRDRKVYGLSESNPADVNSVAFADYAEAMEEYTTVSSGINAEGTPRDFQAAWREHLKAWRDYSTFLNQSADISNRTACGLRKFKANDETFNNEINRTWYEVLRIGRSYGAGAR